MTFKYSQWPQIRFFIDDYIQFGKRMGLYDYISRYLFMLEIREDKEKKRYGQDYDEVCQMCKRLNKGNRFYHPYLDTLDSNLDLHYYNYSLRPQVPTMEINKGFMDFCDSWEKVYRKASERLLGRVIYPAQLSFKKRILNPHTEIGYKYMIKNMEPLFM
mgnify:FL=1|tara:strand:- start:379 stop:855 length:477 start_codon:yes stop_codon:yes gene_type:complete